MRDYKLLVLDLLQHNTYPVLQKYIILDIWYKTIPVTLTPCKIRYYSYLQDNPFDVYLRDSEPFRLSYLVPLDSKRFCMYFLDTLAVDTLPEHCCSVRLDRSFLDTYTLGRASATFEEEIYHFITLLNFDMLRVAPLLNLTLLESTRFLPQRLRLWTQHFDVRTIVPHPPVHFDHFGPVDHKFPARLLKGRLSPCTSRSTILSLNDDTEYTYTQHLVPHCKAVVTLAFNPLENPILV